MNSDTRRGAIARFLSSPWPAAGAHGLDQLGWIAREGDRVGDAFQDGRQVADRDALGKLAGSKEAVVVLRDGIDI